MTRAGCWCGHLVAAHTEGLCAACLRAQVLDPGWPLQPRHWFARIRDLPTHNVGKIIPRLDRVSQG